MDTDAIYSAVCDYGRSCRSRNVADEADHFERIIRHLDEADEKHLAVLTANEKLVDEVAELKAKLTDKAYLLRGCYAADHKQKQRIEELTAERDALKAELDAEREESKRWLVKAQNERDARKELEAELERIKLMEPVAWLSTDCIGERYLAFGRPLDNDPVQPLYALGSKT